jgi:hypothetical protein
MGKGPARVPRRGSAGRIPGCRVGPPHFLIPDPLAARAPRARARALQRIGRLAGGVGSAPLPPSRPSPRTMAIHCGHPAATRLSSAPPRHAPRASASYGRRQRTACRAPPAARRAPRAARRAHGRRPCQNPVAGAKSQLQPQIAHGGRVMRGAGKVCRPGAGKSSPGTRVRVGVRAQQNGEDVRRVAVAPPTAEPGPAAMPGEPRFGAGVPARARTVGKLPPSRGGKVPSSVRAPQRRL